MGRGGAVGSLVAFPLRRLIGFWGAFLVLFAVLSVGVLVLTKATIRDVGHTIADGWRWLRRRPRRGSVDEPMMAPLPVPAAAESKPRPQSGPPLKNPRRRGSPRGL